MHMHEAADPVVFANVRTLRVLGVGKKSGKLLAAKCIGNTAKSSPDLPFTPGTVLYDDICFFIFLFIFYNDLCLCGLSIVSCEIEYSICIWVPVPVSSSFTYCKRLRGGRVKLEIVKKKKKKNWWRAKQPGEGELKRKWVRKIRWRRREGKGSNEFGGSEIVFLSFYLLKDAAVVATNY
ncbi:hypothetical protein L873DRAFT_1423767 [Choiromyces venosus 120613-1]|uniref:Uncharacterized protein n=1 Tax=Choiromyces venosus 120613-1 TaxID=1336337 RepID=A0A3N4J874_9PEZI|nr:hypothetical protein L873DRAFT_1423767 [Choiromyces venosus 120613-1]